MNSLLLGKQIDLVDFDDLKLLMFANDTLYNIAVEDRRKRQSLTDHQNQVLRSGYPPFALTPQNMAASQSVRYCLFYLIHHLWQSGVNPTVLDVGSFVGDFSLRMGSLVRTFQRPTRVISFDPSEAGALVPYNIEINGLQAIVQHEDLAVSDVAGLRLFSAHRGHSESAMLHDAAARARPLKGLTILRRFTSRLLGYEIKRPAHYLVRSTTLPQYLRQHDIQGDLLVKIDVEGHDMAIIDSLLPERAHRIISIVFEYAPGRFPGRSAEANDYLRQLAEDHWLFDLVYCPNPTRVRRIEPAAIAAFTEEVARRRFGYSDVLLLDKRTPNVQTLLQRFSQLSELLEAYWLT